MVEKHEHIFFTIKLVKKLPIIVILLLCCKNNLHFRC